MFNDFYEFFFWNFFLSGNDINRWLDILQIKHKILENL